MKTLDEIINELINNTEIQDEINNINDILIQKYNKEMERIENIEDDDKRNEELSLPLLSLDNEFFRLRILIEHHAEMNMEEYINSNEFKQDRLYNKDICTINQLTAYIAYFLTDNNMFNHFRYEYCKINFYF